MLAVALGPVLRCWVAGGAALAAAGGSGRPVAALCWVRQGVALGALFEGVRGEGSFD